MKRKVLCIALALMMCMLVALPAFADSSADITPQRAGITATFGLKNTSGSTYRMWAKISNPAEVSVYARLTLYDASYNSIASVSTTSSNSTISLNNYLTLSSGTYHLRLTFTAEGATHTAERTYAI